MSLANSENRKLIADFFAQAAACVVTDPTAVSFERMRMTEGVLFNVSDAAIAAQNAALTKLIKALGPIRGHRSDIEPSMWKMVVDVLITGKSAASAADIDSFLSDLETISAQSVRLLKPCQNVRLGQSIRAIRIGPVTVRRVQPALPSLRKSCPKVQFQLASGPNIISEGGFEVQLPPVVWDVELTAAKQLRDQEAAWLIDVALSVVRLAVKQSELGRMAPGTGKVEAHPINATSADHNGITIGPVLAYSFGGWTLPNTYELGRPAQRAVQSKKIRDKAALVFAPAKKSLAERFAQGLGWMSRGRQSGDRPTRLLYFFTAIEALLSDSDKTSPIVQTVARHAAVILTDDNSKRALISKDIRTLYGLRSSLVHTGKRGVYDQDSNTIQYIAELLFWNVWTRVDLAMSHERFVQVLSNASYGSKLSSALK